MNPPEEILPRPFGKYHLIERVATGGMAELYRAKLYGAGGFEKDLAIKKVLPHLARDQAFVQMFLDEAMITVTLTHGNIVSVLDFGQLDGEYFLVMEFVDGVDLQGLIKRSIELNAPMPQPLAVHVALEICRGLEYAHNKLGPDGKPLQIVHRDVSPQNILVSFEGQVKIVDFGIARAASRITSTQAGVVKGKVAYMSPEQLLGQQADRRTDVFAAGIILYEMLTNRRPFEGATPQETMALISQGNYPPPQKLQRGVDRRLVSVIKKALERTPKKRFESAGAMAAALTEAMFKSGLHADPSTLAAFIRERLPEAKPRTVLPTPIRRLRQEPTPQQPAYTPPAGPAAGSKPAEVTAPMPAEPPAAPATSFPAPARRPAEPVAPPADESEAVVVADGEAIAFNALGLPSEYLVEGPESQRPTDPQRPAAAAPDPGLLAAETKILQAAEAEIPRATEEPVLLTQRAHDPALLAAKTRLLETSAPPAEAPAPVGPALLAAETRILDARATPAEPAPPADPSVSDAMRSWMKREEPAGFEDEPAPGSLRPARGRSRATGWVVALVVLIAGAALATLFWPTGGNGSPPAVDTPPTSPGTSPAEVTTKPPEAEPAPPPAVEPSPVPPPEPAAEPQPVAKPTPEPPPAAKPTTTPPPVAVPAPKPKPTPKPTPRVQPPPKPRPAPTGDRVAKVAPPPKTGTLRINSEPFAVVYLGKEKIGPTPQMNVSLPVGSHTLTLRNEALGITKRIRVRIDADKVHTVFVDLKQK